MSEKNVFDSKIRHFNTHQNYKFGFKDNKGNIIIPQEYDKVLTNFTFGLCGVAKANDSGVLMCGFINEKGEVVIPLIYDTVTIFFKVGSKIVAEVELGGEKFYINRKGIKTIAKGDVGFPVRWKRD
jgi:hypothetical protein